MATSVRRILIADDHHVIRRGIRELIQQRRELVVVAEAADGREALEEARRTLPDIAVIDYSMPELNGLDLTRALKRELPRIEVLIFSMHDHEQRALEALRAGARGYVLKSDNELHLLAAIDALSIHRPYVSGAVSEALLALFLNTTPAERTALTNREREVVQLIAEGKINKQISGVLDITTKTVESHRASAMHKLKLHSTAELVRYAIRNNIVEA